MSTTHSISNYSRIDDADLYTSTGGSLSPDESRSRENLSIILLNQRTDPFREPQLDALSNLPAGEILSLESAPGPPNLLNISRQYDNLRFLIFPKDENWGIRINTAFNEAKCDYCLVLPDRTQLHMAKNPSLMLKEIMERQQLCTAPVLFDKDGNTLPTAVGPMPDAENRFQALPTAPGENESPTLLPWNYCGIYTRNSHLSLGGFDPAIHENWWQLLEYGMRAWLWGEEISICPNLHINHLTEIPPVDMSHGQGYRRFFLKTIAVQRRGEAGILTRFQWWSYLRDSGDTSTAAGMEWKDIRHWVKTHRRRFIMDAKELAKIWQWTPS